VLRAVAFATVPLVADGRHAGHPSARLGPQPGRGFRLTVPASAAGRTRWPARRSGTPGPTLWAGAMRLIAEGVVDQGGGTRAGPAVGDQRPARAPHDGRGDRRGQSAGARRGELAAVARRLRGPP